MKMCKKIVSSLLILTMISLLLVTVNCLAENVNFAIYSPAKKLDLWGVKHTVDDIQVLANTTVVASSNNGSFGGAAAVLDGVSMIGTPSGVDPDVILTDGMDLNGENFVKHKSRWVAGAGSSMQSLTFTFNSDIIFNKVKWSEVRSVIGECEVICYKDNAEVYRYQNQFTEGLTNTRLILKEINLPQTVVADKVELNFNSWLVSNVISIAEVEFWGFDSINGASDISAYTDNGATDLSIGLENAFDANNETVYTVDTQEITEPVEIKFDYLDYIIADTLYIRTDDIEDVLLWGSIDGENYFEIDYICDGECYSFSAEYLKSVKISMVPVAGVDEISISDIELYEIGTNEEIHAMMDFFNGLDTSCITDEPTNKITQPIKTLPDRLGAYDIIWTSENDTIINVDTGEITRKYVAQNVKIYASFVRREAVYKTNTYALVIADDGSLESKNKFRYSSDYTNLGNNIISAQVWDANNLNPTNSDSGQGTIEALFDEAHKTDGFDSSNLKSWSVLPLTSSKYVYTFPYTFQFEFDTVLSISKLDIHEFRNRMKKLHIDVSVDGETWTTVASNVTFNSSVNSAEEIYLKTVEFPHTYAKYVRVVVDAVENTTSFATLKFCEFVFYDAQDVPVTASGENAMNLVDRDSDTYLEILESDSITMDLGTIDGFSGLRWTSDGASVEAYEVFVSNDGIAWNSISTGTLDDLHTIADVSFDYQIARFIKLDINSVYSDESAKISEMYVVDDSEIGAFVNEKGLVDLIKNNKSTILTDENLTLLTAEKVNICDSVGDFNLEWDFTQATMINPETGDVTHKENDILGKIGVKVSFKETGVVIYTKTFDVVSKAMFDVADYHVAASRELVSDSIYDFDRPEGFFFNQDDSLLEFEIAGEGNVAIMSDSNLFELELTDSEIVISYCDGEERIACDNNGVKVRALLYNDKFDLYLNYDDTRYRGVIADAMYLSDNSEGVKSLKKSGVTLSNVRLGIQKNYVEDFLNQLDFSFISDESMYTLTNDVKLKNSIIGLSINWTSSDNEVVNSKTGKVNTSAQPSYVKLTAEIDAADVINWSKDLYAAINLPNVISEANVSVNAITYQNNGISNVKDDSGITSYLTNYKNGYSVVIKFADNRMISQVALIEDRSAGSIKSYDIYIDDTKVFSGSELNGFSNCILDCMEGKELKIKVNATEGITGFSEIAVHSQPTLSQKAKLDLKTISMQEKYPNGSYNLIKTGSYGSTFEYSSNKEVVTFEKSDSNVIMNVNNDGLDTNVTITVTANNGSFIETKTHTIVAGGKKTITTSPGSGGGGGGISGGGNKQNLYTGTTSAPAADIYFPLNPQDEISGHWGEKEIRSLIDRDIVQGDGAGYQLEKTVSRSEFITMLLRALKAELSANKPEFSDIASNDWYADEIQTAFELGWIEGYNNCAYPNAAITREEMAKIICKAMNIEISANAMLDFTDKEEQSQWAVAYINSLYSYGIINGYEDGSFRPKNALKRDESMIVIYRILEKEVK